MSQDDSIEDRARKVFSERAQFYTASAAHTDPQVLGRLLALVDPQPHWHMLDVATGTGHTAFAFSPYVAAIVGIDLTAAMLREAKELAESRNITNVRFELGDIHELPFDSHLFDDDTYDLITCRRAAHHFSDVEIALGEMMRMLKPGGLLCIDDRSVPEDDSIDSVMNRLDWLHDDSHVRQYRPSEWQAMLAAAGCQVLTVEPYEKLRPITSLTDGVSPDKVAQIHDLLNGLSENDRDKLGLVSQQGQLYSTHWYLIIVGRKGV